MNQENIFFALKTNSYNKILKAVEEEVFPGAAAAILYGKNTQRVRCIQCVGHTDWQKGKRVDEESFYDLASLTKPLVVVLSLLCLIKQGKLDISQNLAEILRNEKLSQEIGQICLDDLLAHCSGYPAHRPYFKNLLLEKNKGRRAALLRLLIAEPLVYQRRSRSVYSDLGFMLLGSIIERLAGENLADFFRKNVTDPLGLSDQLFFPADTNIQVDSAEYVPGEFCRIRQRILRGEVSDENAWAMGGVAGHAGLFGTIQGVACLVEHLFDQWQGVEEHPNYRAGDLQFFLKRREIPGSTWALGFDTPSAEGSSAGRYFSSTSVGHLGFTGTSFWMDPEKNLIVVLLSNRVHPSRDNEKIRTFRPVFHNMVVESLGFADRLCL